MSGARLGGQPFDAEFLVVIGLRDGGVGLMASRGRHAFVLVEDLGRSPEGLFEAGGAAQGTGAPLPQDLEDFVGDVDPALGADLLLDEVHREDGGKHVGGERFAIGSDRRGHRMWEVGRDVVPLTGHFVFVQEYLDLIHDSSPLSG